MTGGLWVSAGLLFLVAWGFLWFHLGVKAAWQDAQEKIDLIRWATKEQEAERRRQQEEDARRRTEALMGLERRSDG